MLPCICIQPLFHRKEEQLAFRTRDLQLLEPILRTIPFIKYSLTYKCWYLPMKEAYYKSALAILKPHVSIDLSLLRPYLQKRRRILVIKNNSVIHKARQLTPKTYEQYEISTDNFKQLELTVTTLKLMAYSASTLEIYRNELLYLMRPLKEQYIGHMEAGQVRTYCLWLLEKRKLSEAKVHSTINALKCYFEKVLHRTAMFIEVPRPKKPMQLPAVWSAR